MSSSTPQYLSTAEFISEGYLQELNRQFLHPLGLALEVVVESDGAVRFGGVWDYRATPLGITYAPQALDNNEARRKAANVAVKRALKARHRRREFNGREVQPIPEPVHTTVTVTTSPNA